MKHQHFNSLVCEHCNDSFIIVFSCFKPVIHTSVINTLSVNLWWLPTVIMFQFTYCLKVYYFFFVKVVALKLSHHITMMHF